MPIEYNYYIQTSLHIYNVSKIHNIEQDAIATQVITIITADVLCLVLQIALAVDFIW